MFLEEIYDDSMGPIDVDAINTTYMKDCYVRIIVESKSHSYSFDRFLDKLYDSGVAKITTVEGIADYNKEDEEFLDLAQDTVTLINNEIESIDEVKDKARMKKLIKDLYMESLSL
jgi:ribonucleotide reductase beta subunit family protein with ferritin-like domain